jgi:hypothetical protein
MQDDDIQVPVDLPVSGTSAPDTSEPLAQPDKAAPSTGTEQPAEDAAPAEEQTTLKSNRLKSRQRTSRRRKLPGLSSALLSSVKNSHENGSNAKN